MPPVWVSIEQESTPGLPISLYLYSSDIKTLTRRTKNPLLKNTILVWYAAHKHIGDMTVLSQFTPVWGNEQFIPGWKDGGFRSWIAKGIQKVKDLFLDEVLLSFDHLCQRCQNLKKHFFKYLQLKGYMSSKHKQIMGLPSLSKVEETTLGTL